MPETIHDGIWRWHDVMHDLDEQGGFPGVVIDPFTVGNNFCAGQTDDGTKITVTWLGGIFMLVSMQKDIPELAEAFAKVVGYEPFCRYVEPDSGLITYEWDKKDPNGRYEELSSSGKHDLTRLESAVLEA